MIHPRTRPIARVILVLVLVAVFLFTPVAAVRFIAMLMIALTAASVLYTVTVRGFVEVSRPVPVVYAGRRTKFTVTLLVRNRSILPIPLVQVQDASSGFQLRTPATFALSLPPRGRRICEYEAISISRGEFMLDRTFLYGRDFLHMFGWTRRLTAPMRVIVYPSVYPLTLKLDTGLPSGPLKVASKLYEDVTRFRSVREYTPGDELKRINWKVSARFGTLYSMEYVPSIYFPVLIALNLTEKSYPISGRASAVELAVATAASLVSHFVDIGQEVGLVTTGSIHGEAGHPVAPSRGGHGHAIGILEKLARISLSSAGTDAVEYIRSSGVKISTAAKIVLVTPPLSEEQKESLVGLHRRGHDVTAYLVSSRTTHQDELQIQGVRTRVVGGSRGASTHG